MCLQHPSTSPSSMTTKSCAVHSAGSCGRRVFNRLRMPRRRPCSRTRKHPQFDCLVLDIELGGMSGIELAEHLLGKGCSTPFIFISAHEHLNARARAQVPGAAAYFRKTDSGADVLDVIRRCVSAGGHG